jgi:MFS family permease
MMGLVFGAVGLVACAEAHSVATFVLALVPLAFGIGFGHPTVSSLVSLVAGADEQGRMQGAAGAVESLGRTLGPVWGNASLERIGDSTPYLTAAAVLVVTLLITSQLPVGDRHTQSPVAGRQSPVE